MRESSMRAVLLSIGAIALGIVACRDNSLEPRPNSKTPHALADQDPASHVQTGTLAAGDGTVGPVIFSGAPYTSPTLVQVVADGIINRNYSNFPYLWWGNAGKAAPPLDPGGEFIWSIYYQCVGNDIIEFINEDGSHGGYVGFCDAFNQLAPQSAWTAPWQVVTGQAQGSRNGGYAQARYSCGGPQDDPCYTYSGSQTVTVTPAPAALQLGSDNTDVGEGDQVTFTGSIQPDSMGGIPIPYSDVQWSWEPDDEGAVADRIHDSGNATRVPATSRSVHPYSSSDEVVYPDSITLGATFQGDLPIDDRPATVACAAGSLICQMRVYGSGTVTLAALVNGAQQTKSTHVSVTYYCPDTFVYPQDPIVVATAHKRLIPGSLPLGDGPVEFNGPYSKFEYIGGTPFPLASYRPSAGDDFDGRLLFSPPTLALGYPPSVAYFQCRQSLKWNPELGEHVLDGRMVFANRVDLYFYHPSLPPARRVKPDMEGTQPHSKP